jgi:cyclic pyranopterin phosphate synthase
VAISPEAEKALLLAPAVHDAFGRRIDYVRLSLTDRCNFRCIYCMPQAGLPFIPHERIVTYEEMLRLCRLMAVEGISRYKITGGEPLCRKGVAGFIRSLAALPGVQEVTMTSNGSLLAPHLEELAECGLSRITFSCNALDQDVFARLSRSAASVKDVRQTMARAAALGMQVRINTVPLRGHNEAELVPLARYALERGHHIRFIELMPVGRARSLAGVPQKEVFAAMHREFGPLRLVSAKTGNGPAVVYSVPGHPGHIGFIAALSGRFCDACNRVRLTSTGFLKTCLCHDAGVDCRAPMRAGATDGELLRMLRQAVDGKPKGHAFSLPPDKENGFFMNAVGG